MTKLFVLFILFLNFSIGSFAADNPKYEGWHDPISMDEISNDKIRDANDNWNSGVEDLTNNSRTLHTISPKRLLDLQKDYEMAKEEKDVLKEKRTIAKIQEVGKKAAEILGVQYNLTKMFNAFMGAIRYIGWKLMDVSAYLLGWLILLEGLHMLMDSPTQFPMGKIMILLVKYGLLRFLIRFWFHLMSILKSDIRVLASIASGMGHNSAIKLSPQNIFDTLAQPITTSWELIDITNVVWALVLLIGMLLCLLVTVEFFMAELEFYLLCGFAIILVPFLGWKQTQGIGMKIGAVLSSQAARLLMLYFFLMTTLRIVEAGKNPFPFYVFGSHGLVLCFKYCLILYTLYIFIGKSQALAGTLMSGGAGAIGGRDASGAIGSALAKGVMATAGAIGLASGAIKLGRSEAAANIVGGARSVMSKTMSGAAKLYNSATKKGNGGDSDKGGSS